MGISTVDSLLILFQEKKKASVLTVTYKTPCVLAAIIVWPHLHRVYSTLGTHPLRLSSISQVLMPLGFALAVPFASSAFPPDIYMADSLTSFRCFSKYVFSVSPFLANVCTP